ncbi:MAG: SH3 domain-containing protein, partial [Pseudomonadota bacterium]
ASSASAANDRVVITANAVNVRQGPNTDNPALFTLDSGTIVEVTARAGDWLSIRDDQGQTGWIAAEHTLDLR